MKLAWSPQARLKYSAVLLDVRDKNGYQSAQKLNKEVKEILKRINKFPDSAQEEVLLDQSRYTFRSVPFGSCNKLVYHVDGIYISIDNIWDTRREPKIQVEETTK